MIKLKLGRPESILLRSNTFHDFVCEDDLFFRFTFHRFLTVFCCVTVCTLILTYELTSDCITVLFHTKENKKHTMYQIVSTPTELYTVDKNGGGLTFKLNRVKR